MKRWRARGSSGLMGENGAHGTLRQDLNPNRTLVPTQDHCEGFGLESVKQTSDS